MNRKARVQGRLANSLLNSISGLLLSMITTLLAFAVRTVFIKCLDEIYLGVNGLFSNILTMLSLTELGIGNAIIFRLYRPIAEGNIEELKSLIRFYRKCYAWVGTVVLTLGLALTPFLKYLIKIDEPIPGLYIIYVIYVLDTVSSYLFVYKLSLITANQRERVVSMNTLAMNITTSVLQILVLVFSKNFYLYLIVKIICMVSFRYVLSRKADKDYSYIRDKEYSELSVETKKSIFSDVKCFFAYKIGSVILYGSDNVIISMFVSTNAVGIYSNYYLIINAVKTLLTKVMHGFTASIGNLNSIGDDKKKTETFYIMNYVAFWLFCFGSACLLALTESFITLWIGRGFLMNGNILIVLVICFYISGFRQASTTYRETLGLFRRGKFCPVIAAVLNIILSIIGALTLGVLGVFIATILSQLVTTLWFEPYIICKYGLYISPWNYYRKFMFYLAVSIIVSFLTCGATANILYHGVSGFILKVVTAFMISNGLIVILTCWTKEFRIIFQRIRQGI